MERLVKSWRSIVLSGLSSFLATIHINGQTLDTTFIKATYSYNVRPDSISSISVVADVYNLEIGSKFTKFYSYYRQIADSVLLQQYNAQVHAEGVPLKADMRGVPNGSKKTILREVSRNLFIVSEKLGLDTYRYTDTITNLPWVIQPDTATISNFFCNKATLRFRGRNYVAWFDKSVPVSAGPFLFYGLPGLIIKICEGNGKFEFELKTLEKIRTPIEVKYKKVIQVSREEYRRVKKLDVEDPEALLASQGMTFQNGTVNGQPETPSMHKKNKYSPIELE